MLKAALCTRRAGKSYGCGLYLLQEAIAHPGSTSLFIGLTRESAKRIFVRDILKAIAEQQGIKGSYNAAELSFTLNNGPSGGPGSVIYIMGADASEGQRDKLLGQAYRLVVIDECASFRQDLESVVMDTLLPTVTGTIALIGTPGNTKGFFYRVTTGEVPGWSVHKWTYADNPYWKERIERTIQILKTNNPDVIETPAFRRNYLGEWTIDDSSLVYKFNAERNTIDALPEDHSWNYIISVDPGYTDSTAMIVLAYSLVGEKVVYVVDYVKAPKMITAVMVQQLQKLIDTYEPIAVVIDAAGRQSVEDMKVTYGLPLKDAEKRDKANAQEMLNSDLITSRIKVVVPPSLANTHPLIEEWENLVWDERARASRIWKEHSACENHLSDAMLYAWRESRHYAAQDRQDPAPGRDSEAWVKQFWKRDTERRAAKAETPWWERDNPQFIGGDGDDW